MESSPLTWFYIIKGCISFFLCAYVFLQQYKVNWTVSVLHKELLYPIGGCVRKQMNIVFNLPSLVK
jgi:hypothetical protein